MCDIPYPKPHQSKRSESFSELRSMLACPTLVRSGRKQPQREHCVPGCGWWGYHLNALLQPCYSLAGNRQSIRAVSFFS
ncbi:hypothetical protein EMIT0P176_70092 [Pseudomonas sp. IT-P176]